jgi:hypothetical protein
MAQADSVPISSRQLITGESASQSTNLGAVNLPAVIKPGDRRYLIGGSHARRIIGGDEAAPLRLGREKRGDESEDPLKCRWDGANAGRVPMGSNIEALFFAKQPFSWGGCSGGLFRSCCCWWAGTGAYATAHSTRCHRTSWSDRAHRRGCSEHN